MQMLVRKTLNFADAEIKMASDTGRFSGYASKWNGVDSYGDTILKGAFAKSLAAGMPKMFFNHDWNMPVGKWLTAQEDDIGLYVEGELTPNLSISADVHAAMKHGTLDGLSIGGYLKKGDYDETENGRTIRSWSNLMEVSAVVFPADGKARIESVKSEDMMLAINEIESIREFERFLRDAGNFSKGAALALTARMKAVIATECEAGANEAQMKMIEARLQKLAES
jgi:hypothetical protein